MLVASASFCSSVGPSRLTMPGRSRVAWTSLRQNVSAGAGPIAESFRSGPPSTSNPAGLASGWARSSMTSNRTPVSPWRPTCDAVNYLGYPCTVGASYIDYVIADAVLVPPELRGNYTEKIAYLPNCYQPNDRQREISPRVFNRAECGLPEQGFVFACLNVQWKILPMVFDVWMRILQKVPGSVLWLLDDNEEGSANLRLRASERGVDPARLVFAPRMVFDEHLARQRLADLFLDTAPYNSHTTGSDALWAGVPLLTVPGQTFASRVGASLLTAAGLPELIATDFVAYEAMAVGLEADFGKIFEFKKRLVDTHLSCALFDTPRFARDIEALYQAMWERYQAGLPPDHLCD